MKGQLWPTELSPLLTLRMQIFSNACSRLYFSHYFWILCWKTLTSEHKIEFLRLMAEKLQTLQAKGLIFLIIFGFFVENHLLANTKSRFYDLQFESYNLCRQQAFFSHYFWILHWKSHTSKQKIQFPWLTFWELQSLPATGLIFLIIFSFFVEKHKLQFPQLMVLEFCVWFTFVELSPTAGLSKSIPW